MKMDSRNTRSLVAALTRWDPDIYMETHVSDGADHRYLMELLLTHRDKLDPTLRSFANDHLLPGLYTWMERKDIGMCPYFETVDGPRSTGWRASWTDHATARDSPRSKGASGCCPNRTC